MQRFAFFRCPRQDSNGSNLQKVGKISITTAIQNKVLTVNIIKVEDLPKWGIIGAPGKFPALKNKCLFPKLSLAFLKPFKVSL